MRSVAQLLLTFLLNASWQIAVVCVFAACCSWLLRGTPAWCRHSVWVAAIVISLCLPIISSLNRLELSPLTKQKISTSETEKRVSGPASLQELDLIEPRITAIQMPVVESKQRSRWNSPISVNRNLAAVLVTFYALFLLYRGFKLVRAWGRTTAIMRSACSTPVSGRAATIAAKCQTAIGVSSARVVCSTSILVPITAGVFNPLVILPAQLLSEPDEEILLSAIGHELVHVARRDYILNLVYELIYLPISFHPAAAMLRRRIKQTRELCCDELVARKLMAPEVYARSLVRLVGSVPLAGRLVTDTTIGITDADILEVRIMTLLNTSKLSPRRKSFLLIAACLLLAAPCVAAAAFALQFNIDNPKTAASQEQEQGREASQKLERAREELQQKERELTERVRKNSNPQGEELETQRRMESELREASAKLSREVETLHLKETELGIRQLHERLAQIISTYPADESRMREVREKLAQLQQSLPENQERSRELREQLAMIEKQYPNAAQMAEQLQLLRRAQEEVAQQQKGLEREQREKIEEKLKQERRIDESEQEARERLEKRKAEAGKLESKIRSREHEKLIREDIDTRIHKELKEALREGHAKEQAELTQLATMSMDRAIQIAVSQHPGKVLSCNLGRQKDGEAFYRLVIINGEGEKSSATHVWVSATDGRILKTEHE
jgi:beta-lactamase regulating signal transducer with metallopeptidase domain/uncharacterized membrane protein YkoI